MQDIAEFSGPHRFLSNFWPADVILDGVIYPSVEHAYQAAKAHPSQRTPFRTGTPGQAKRLGRGVPLPTGWELDKISTMRSLIAQKFSHGSKLGEMLVSTGFVQIIEGNTWGDRFWGVCRGEGRNMLGEILMTQRTFLITADAVRTHHA